MDYDTDSNVEVKEHNGKLVLFLNDENLRVGWKSLAPKDLMILKIEMEAQFPLLDLYDEYETITADLLLPLIEDEVLTKSEAKRAVGAFMYHFKVFKYKSPVSLFTNKIKEPTAVKKKSTRKKKPPANDKGT